jgi:choice-of-anchor C domain-containing protein
MKPVNFFFIASAILATPSARAANIIDSIYGAGAGSFEAPVPAFTTFATYQVGSTAIAGWTVNTVNIDWVKDSVWNASNGHYSIDMNGTNLPSGTPSSPGGIQTMITTTVGSTYRVTFDISGFVSEGNATNPKVMKTVAGGITTVHYFTATQSYTQPFSLPFALNWSTRSFDFVATSASSTVSFVSLVSNDGSAMLLDNVVIEAVPEPSAVLLVAAGSMSFALRRRRQIPSAAAL